MPTETSSHTRWAAEPDGSFGGVGIGLETSYPALPVVTFPLLATAFIYKRVSEGF